MLDPLPLSDLFSKFRNQSVPVSQSCEDFTESKGHLKRGSGWREFPYFHVFIEAPLTCYTGGDVNLQKVLEGIENPQKAV
ncbi:MAG: hypothetical protein BAA01_05010 [Bacillus thermozeamaize]|uniref:Uncharacterized protein n=1 Tax=Bacillus thermozeamaize TaxID=230954 RepID=A0A1Y3PTI1_9BACI|nr:MAG: hypothetical protein BAA01_05010 [Bacillus thermozeamaize]